MSKLGDAIGAARLRRDWSQHDLAAAAGVPQNVISRIERGDRIGSFVTIAASRSRSISTTTPSRGTWWTIWTPHRRAETPVSRPRPLRPPRADATRTRV